MAINPEILKVPMLDIQFMEDRNGKLQFLSFIAKRARGEMARYIVENKIKTSKDLKTCVVNGYTFRSELSDARKLVFVR